MLNAKSGAASSTGQQWRLYRYHSRIAPTQSMIGHDLIVALSRTKLAVIEVVDRQRRFQLSPADAIRFVADQPDIRGYGHKRKVTRIERFAIIKPAAPWQSCWRTDGGSAAVLVRVAKPSQGYLGVTEP